MSAKLRSIRRVGLIVAITAATAIGAAACGGGSSKTAVKGGTATFVPPVGAPNWILPLEPAADATFANQLFNPLEYRPLIDVGGNGHFAITALGIANRPVFSGDGRTVTVTLKPWKWSDGKPVTTRDIAFDFNLVRANKSALGFYVPGLFPDNVASLTVKSSRTFELHLKHRYAQDWFTINELTDILPLPQHVWDKTSANGAVGNYDETPSGAKAVFRFLLSQAKDTSTYGTNPLWRVVDGPFILSQYRSDGYSAFIPNHHFSGTPKPSLDKFIEEPFTSASAELNVLRSHGIDVGFLPSANINEQPAINSLGYHMNKWPAWGFNYIQLNFNNPTVGSLFKQLYIRQALMSLVDEPSYLKHALHGAGEIFYGPVPEWPPNPYYNPIEKQNATPFNPAHAVALLKAHGWAVKPNGVSTCARPGTAANQCGAGIPAGKPLVFKLLYLSGSTTSDQEMQAFQSDATKAGVKLNLSTAPFSTVYADSARCKPTQSSCGWQMNYYTGWGYGEALPTGETLFACNGGSNYGSFCDPTLDRIIRQTITVGSPQSMAAWQARVSHDIPELWMPGGVISFTEIKNGLQGVVPQSPVEFIYPERWHYTR